MRLVNGVRPKRWRWVILAGLGFAFPAYGQSRPPSDTELRAAYCVGVVEAQVVMIRQMAGYMGDHPPTAALAAVRQQQTDTEQRLARLRAYLIPKLPYLDPIALVAAKQRSDADIALAQVEGAKVAKSCAGRPPLDMLKCANDAPGTEVTSRIKACADTSWMPF